MFSGYTLLSTCAAGSTSSRQHPCVANPVLDGLLHEYQSLGVAPSTRRTYRAGVRSYQQFCNQFNIQQFPATSLTLRYFCTSIAQRVSYKTIRVYLAGIRLEHLERGLHEPTDDKLLQLLCTAIKRSQETTSCTRLPITIDLLRSLKTQLQNDSSYSLLEKRLCSQHSHWLFMASLGSVSLCHQACIGRMSSSQLLPLP